jgi:hypothetical protein
MRRSSSGAFYGFTVRLTWRAAKNGGLHQTVDAQRPRTAFIAWRTQCLAVLLGWNAMSFDDRRVDSVRGKPDRRHGRSRRE